MAAMGDQPMTLELQVATTVPELPPEADFRRWAEAALEDEPRRDLVIRIVDEEESRELNCRYRGKDRPTNVLSFPFEAPPGVESDHLGDLVICAPVVAREAAEQGKPLEHHWAHMVVHGVLHLRGYDHLQPEEAEAMEARERRVLARFGIPDPYQEAA
jgi:probable rRNA maturation factor